MKKRSHRSSPRDHQAATPVVEGFQTAVAVAACTGSNTVLVDSPQQLLIKPPTETRTIVRKVDLGRGIRKILGN